MLRFGVMTPEVVRAMARYNRWMNEKVYASAALLGDEECKRDRGAFFKSIHGTLNHLLVADRIWLGRLHGVVPPDGLLAIGVRALDQELFADFAELRAERQRTDQAIDAWATTVTAQSFGEPLRYVSGGRQREYPLWWVAMHVFNHQTHHRGQITTLLLQAGQDPGSADLLAMLMEEEKAGAGTRAAP
jgi:uncharacterized damage-inducible protein DinB